MSTTKGSQIPDYETAVAMAAAIPQTRTPYIPNLDIQKKILIPKSGRRYPIRDNQPEFNPESDRLWAVRDNNSFFPCEQSIKTLPSSQYVINRNDDGFYFTERKMEIDQLYRFPDSAFDEVVCDIENFWSREQQFRDFGFLWKRGILLYGPPGSGKTSLIHIISSMIVERGGIVIYGSEPYRISGGLQILRKIEPTRPVVVILEDIDAIVRGDESALLALLDGELQIDNIVTIATTNYPERLDRRLINRPSRFDIVKRIDMPSPAARRMFLELKHKKLSPGEMDVWIDATHNYSMAHLKELIVSVECLGANFDETVSRLNHMIATGPTSDEYENMNKSVFGFSDSKIEVAAASPAYRTSY